MPFAAYGEGGILTYETRRTDDGAFAVDVTDCGYAKLMDELGARDLGDLLLCAEDEVAVARAGTVLERTQTRMRGASHCDFCFRAKPTEAG